MTHPLALAGIHKLVAWLVLFAYAASVVWTFRDARRRGESGVAMSAGVALFFWPLGLICWFVARPPIRPCRLRETVRTSVRGGGGEAALQDEDFIF